MPKRAMESMTESMFYTLMALLAGPRCGTEIAAFVKKLTEGRVVLGPAPCTPSCPGSWRWATCGRPPRRAGSAPIP